MDKTSMKRFAFNGVGVSPGRVVGPVVGIAPPIKEPSNSKLPADADVTAAVESIKQAAAKVADDLITKAQNARDEAKMVLEMTSQMAMDPMLCESASSLVVQQNLTPERATWVAAGEIMDQLAALGGYMAERTRDVADVRDRIVAILTGQPIPGLPERDTPYILTAVDLAPADTALLDPNLVVALVTDSGGPTSHTAILARSLGIPAVVATHEATALADGTIVIVDGGAGSIIVNPTQVEIQRARAMQDIVRTFDGVGKLKDGYRVALLANVGDAAGAKAAAEANAEGVGLFRTEFCFLDRTEEPSIEEQKKEYIEIFKCFPNKKVVVRTLDAGADKPLPFVTPDNEENPALGVRGFRTARAHPEILRHQLEAIAQAADATRAEVWVMAPMVSTMQEVEEFSSLAKLYSLHHAGIMVEVPSAALNAEHMLKVASFASLGTNDLTQYAMAADRLVGSLADLSDAWQPSVLKLIKMTADGGKLNDRPVGVCGEAAADPALAVVLVGLGVSYLSMSARALADVSATLAQVELPTCQKLAQLALTCKSAKEARAMVREELPFLSEWGL